MSNKNLFKEAIADAKAVREAALANAKAALEEALTPKLQSMLAAKLNEMEYEEEELEETKESDKKEKMEEVDISSNGHSSDDIWHTRAHAASQADAIGEGKEEEDLEEDFDLSEILAELNEAEEEEKEEEETEETEEEGEEEVEVKDMTIEDLKDLIKDIVSQEMGDETPEMGAEEPVDMGGEEMAADAGAEDEIDLEELLAELDSLDEYAEEQPSRDMDGDGDVDANDVKMMKEAAKKKKEKEKEEKKEKMNENLEEGLKDFFLKVADNLKKGLGLYCVEEYNANIKAGKSTLEAQALYDKCLQGEKGGFQGKSVTSTTTGIAENEELEEAISTINTLRNELNEVNLLNAKLLYVNKIFKAKNLTESQKVKVIASFDKATNVKEAKVVFESLQSALTAAPKKAIKESLGFASKAAGIAPNKTIVESNDVIARMQKLANIK